MARILLVDDEVALLRSMALHLSRAGHECSHAETIAAATEELAAADPEVAIIDLRLPDGNGLDLIRRIRAEGHTFPIIVLTAFGSIPNAVTAMREGTNDYIEKPVDLEQLSLTVARNLETERLRGRIELYERTMPDVRRAPDIVGDSPPMREALELARRAASPGVTEAAAMPTVLLTGETGTGKDLFARYIHAAGPLANEPFVEVDCASLPRELIESELFGHERGAFTDAKQSKKGLLEIAGGGTVFLNEIAELPINLQAKLLTCLEARSFRSVGGTRSLRMNARIVAATNADLSRRVDDKAFRGDLYYRLNVFTIVLPPLRERGDDMLVLADHFLGRLCRKYRRPIAKLDEPARAAMTTYRWPGNVRELRHVLERAALLQDSGVVGGEHLCLPTSQAVAPLTANADDATLLKHTLPELERRTIQAAMQKAEGNVSKAARLLGISRGALRRRIESATKGRS